jgi:hypothetical protein
MTTREQLAKLMQELGPASPEVWGVTQVTEDSWAIGHLRETTILAQLDEDTGQLLLRAGVGKPEPKARSRLNEVLLAYNALWRDTGGVTMGLVSGEVVQVHAIDAAALDLAALVDALRAFALRAHVWRKVVALGDSPVMGAILPTATRV